MGKSTINDHVQRIVMWMINCQRYFLEIKVPSNTIGHCLWISRTQLALYSIPVILGLSPIFYWVIWLVLKLLKPNQVFTDKSSKPPFHQWCPSSPGRLMSQPASGSGRRVSRHRRHTSATGVRNLGPPWRIDTWQVQWRNTQFIAYIEKKQ